jgi:hypothetical protein
MKWMKKDGQYVMMRRVPPLGYQGENAALLIKVKVLLPVAL